MSNSTGVKVYLSGGYRDTVVLAHEVFHRLSGLSINEWHHLLNRCFFGESGAIYAELLATDALEEKYGRYLDGYISPRFRDLKTDLSESELEIPTYEIFNIYADFLKYIAENEINDDNYDGFKDKFNEINRRLYLALNSMYDESCTFYENYEFSKSIFHKYEGKFTAFSLFETNGLERHNIAWLFANYLHENSDLGNLIKSQEIAKKCIEFDKLYSEDEQDKKIEILTSIGLPLYQKDGKICMDEDGVRKINDAFDKTLEEYIKRSKELKMESHGKTISIETAVNSIMENDGINLPSDIGDAKSAEKKTGDEDKQQE